MEGKTIRQIAEELGVSKGALQKRMAREPLRSCLYPSIDKKGGTKYIDEAGEKLIIKAFSGDGGIDTGIPVSIDASIPTSIPVSIPGDTITADVVALLRAELETKNDQIRQLNDRLAETTAALVAAQQTAQAAQALHAGTLQQQLIEDGAATEQEEPETPPKRPGFLARIFGGGR